MKVEAIVPQSSPHPSAASKDHDSDFETTPEPTTLRRENKESSESSTITDDRTQPIAGSEAIVRQFAGEEEHVDGVAISLAGEAMSGSTEDLSRLEERGGSGKVEDMPYLQDQEYCDKGWYITFEQFISGIQQEPELCQFFAEQSIIDLRGNDGTSVDPVLSSYTRTVLASKS